MEGRRKVVKIIIILLIIGGVVSAILEADSILAKIGIGVLALIVGLVVVMSLVTGVGPFVILFQLIVGIFTGGHFA